MMSRITLHLKKDMESPRSLDPAGSHSTYDLTSSFPPLEAIEPIRFARLSPTSALATPMTVSIQEHSVTHDDHGRQVQLAKKSHKSTHAKRDSWAAQEEWIEFASLPRPGGRDVERIV